MTTAKQRELRALMVDYELTYADVAEIAGVSQKTVEGWLANEDAKSFRGIPAPMLELISMKLKRRRR